MMLQNLIIARLLDKVSTRHIYAAASLAAVQAASPLMPAVFVLSTGEQGGDTRYLSGTVAQKRIASFTIISAVKNVRDAHGAAASSDMIQLRSQIDDALFGWTPDAAYSPIIFSQGASAGFIDQELWWQDHYSTLFDRR